MYVIAYDSGLFYVGRVDDGSTVDWWWDVRTSAWRRSKAVCAAFNNLPAADEFVRRLIYKDNGRADNAVSPQLPPFSQHIAGWGIEAGRWTFGGEQ